MKWIVNMYTTDYSYRRHVSLRIIVSHEKYKMESEQVFYTVIQGSN